MGPKDSLTHKDVRDAGANAIASLTKRNIIPGPPVGGRFGTNLTGRFTTDERRE